VWRPCRMGRCNKVAGRRAAHGRTPSWGHQEPGSINLAVGEYSLVGNKDAEHVRSPVFEGFIKGRCKVLRLATVCDISITLL
jgi:hypothetical protein